MRTIPATLCPKVIVLSRQSSPFNTVDSVVNFGIKHEAPDDESGMEPTTLTTQ